MIARPEPELSSPSVAKHSTGAPQDSGLEHLSINERVNADQLESWPGLRSRSSQVAGRGGL
jgi:hypothetical protein